MPSSNNNAIGIMLINKKPIIFHLPPPNLHFSALEQL